MGKGRKASGSEAAEIIGVLLERGTRSVFIRATVPVSAPRQVAFWRFSSCAGRFRLLFAKGSEGDAIVRWNTRYLDAILKHVQAFGAMVWLEDVTRRSPLLFKHVNVLNRSHFELSPALAHGALRPLADPAGEGEGEEQQP